jgi:serine/threonine protein kinase/putative intracellular protease/amidase
MSSVIDRHPDTATFAAYHCGKLDSDRRAELQEHLAACQECRARLAAEKSQSSEASFDVVGEIDPPPNETDVPAPLIDHPRYKIVGRLGEGGMGVVYKAEHRVMGRTVALKVLTAGTMSSQTAVDRFRREVRLASRLNDPHIVTAYDADEAGGLHFLVMEYVDGLSMERVVRDRGPLPVQMACSVIRQAAIGLQHAHEKGMVHRDIKPHNLMMTKTGHVKILDFGLARVAAANGVDPASLTAMAITNPQTLMGTPDFLSPEQARSCVGLDIRSDLYSLGCTLFFLLTGKPPFGGVGAYAKMIAHFKEPPPELGEARPDAPAQLGRIYKKLMAKSPDDRYQTPNEVAAALQPFTGDDFEKARPEVDNDLPSREQWLADGLAHESEETYPSYATEPSISALPMASEFESSSANKIARSNEPQVNRERQKATRKLSGLKYALAAFIVLGLGLGAVAKWLTGGGQQSSQAPLGESLKQPTTQPPAEQQSQGPTPTPQPVPETKPASTPPPTIVTPPKPAPKTPATTPTVTPPTPPTQAARKKLVLLLVPAEFAFLELGTVTEALKSRDANVTTISFEKKLLEGFRYGKGDKTFGGFHTPDYALKDITAPFLDTVDAVIVLPGEIHTFTDKLLGGPDVKRIVEKAIQKKKVVGAIGSGVIVLGKHGFLENAAASSVQSRALTVSQLKVKAWKDDPKVVVDLPFITSGDFSHSRALVDEVIKAIADTSKR